MADSFDFDSPKSEVEEQPAQEAPKLFYGTVDEFVREHLRFKYRRTVGRPGRADLRWKAAWWESEEAISRLESIWRTWENARQDPIGLSDWWINHCDRQMAVLLSSTGPFAQSEDENKPGDPLPYTPPPPHFFEPEPRA